MKLTAKTKGPSPDSLSFHWLSPCTAVFAVFTFFPILFAFFISFYDWNLLIPDRPFVGLIKLRRALFQDKVFSDFY